MIIDLEYKNANPEYDIELDYTFDGFVDSALGPVARIATRLSAKDYWHDFHARWSIKRNDLRIPVGLYAVGNPDAFSPVLVTANYKLTFDKLRTELDGLDLWILVIDTKGVNVWCSAGKGTFSAPEIIYRIKDSGLEKIVAHKRLILPQLAAPGVIAHHVTKATGFKVIYGPIRAADIKAFIANGYKADPEMRKVHFNLTDRIILTPVELISAVKYIPVFIFLFLLLNIINNLSSPWEEIIRATAFNTLAYLLAIFVGSILVPVLLPLLPFRSFALKGTVAGLIWSLIVIWLNGFFYFHNTIAEMFGNTMLMTAIIAYLSLNFTGSTPYTSFSGTQKETLKSVPIMMALSLLGIISLAAGRFFMN